MMRVKVKVTLVIGFLLLFIWGSYEFSRKDATGIAIKVKGHEYVGVHGEVVWHRLTPYWSITLKNKEDHQITVLVDPLQRRIFAE